MRAPGRDRLADRAAAATAVPTPIERAPRPPIVTRAESAPCTCTEHCERDHEND
jgi:hypothetical protein